MSEQEKNTEQSPEKGKKSFGNTIVLFIVFFIIFTALVTGVAFFADKLKRSGKDAKTTEQVKPEDMTNPDSGKSFTVDGDGNKTETAPAPAEPVVPKPVEAAPDPVLTAPPVEAKPAEPVKQPEPAKPVVKEEPVKPAAPAVKPAPVVKPEPVKPEPVKPAVKAEPVKTAPKPAVKSEPAKPAVKAAAPAAEKKAVVNKPGEYYVQLASFKSLDLAKEEFQRMSGKVNDLQLVQVDLGEKGVWYRLRCGTPLAYDKAVARAEEIAAKTGYKPDIMKK